MILNKRLFAVKKPAIRGENEVKKCHHVFLIGVESQGSIFNETQQGVFGFFSSIYCIQHCFICRPSDSTVSEDAGIEPRTVATSALA
jgi:hypothetical protein